MKKQKLEKLREKNKSKDNEKLKIQAMKDFNIKNRNMFKGFSFISKLESKWSKEDYYKLRVEDCKEFEIDCYKTNKEGIMFINNKSKECIVLSLKNNEGEELFEHKEESETIQYYQTGKKSVEVKYLKESDKIVFKYKGEEEEVKEFKNNKENLVIAKELFNDYLKRF